MNEGFESLLPPDVLDALIEANGDEKLLTPEAQREVFIAKQSVLDAQIDQIKEDNALEMGLVSNPVTNILLNKAPETILETIGSGAGAYYGALGGGKVGGAKGAYIGAGVGGQEGADIGGAVYDAAGELGRQAFYSDAEIKRQDAIDRELQKRYGSPKPGESLNPTLLDKYLDRRRGNVFSLDPSLGGALEAGLNMVGAGKVYQGAREAVESGVKAATGGLERFGKPQEIVDIVNAGGEQLAKQDYTPILNTLNASKKSIANAREPLTSGAGEVGQKAIEVIQEILPNVKSFDELGRASQGLWKSTGEARATLVKDIPVDNILRNLQAESKFSDEGIEAFETIYKQLSTKTAGEDAKALFNNLKQIKAALSKSTPLGVEKPSITSELLLDTAQKLKGIAYDTTKLNIEGNFDSVLMKDLAKKIETGLIDSLASLPDGARKAADYVELTDRLNALNWIRNASLEASAGVVTQGKAALRQADKVVKEKKFFNKFADIFNRGKSGMIAPMQEGEVVGEQLLKTMGAPEARINLLQRQAQAMQSPIQLPQVPGLLDSVGATIPQSLVASQVGTELDSGINGLVGGVSSPSVDDNLAQLGLQRGDVPSLIDLYNQENFGQPAGMSEDVLNQALSLGIDPMNLDSAFMSQQNQELPIDLSNTEDFYADKINIPDALGMAVGKEGEPVQLERSSTAVMEYLNQGGLDSLGLDDETKTNIQSLLSGNEEDQKLGVYELAKAAPNIFVGSKIPGIESLVDGVILDPLEQEKAESLLNKRLESDPVRKFRVLNSIRKQEALPSWSYKYLGGEDQMSFEDKFLEQEEGFRPQAYLDSRGNPTIGTGVNLGAFSVSQLREFAVPESTIAKIAPLLGVKGAVAKERIKNYPVKLTEDEAIELSKAVKMASKSTLEDQYKNETGASLEDLPVQARTVMLSLAYNFGDIKKKLPTFWSYATMGRWDEASDFLERQKWKQPELTQRRLREASLLKEIAPQTIQLAANVSYDDDATDGMVELEDGEKTQTYKF